jgi:hypothetical protein
MMNDLNWRRGLFRLWSVVSVLWLLAMGATSRLVPSIAALGEREEPHVFANPQGGMASKPWERNWTGKDMESCADAREKDPKLGNPFGCFDDPIADRGDGVPRLKMAIRSFVIYGFTPPLLLLALWAVGGWIARGFRSQKTR